MLIFPEIITFRITSRCNFNCKYCCASKNINELNFRKLKKIFSLLSKKGAKAIVLTGGEPLIREDIEKVIKEIKKNNLKIFLDTNGSLFFRHNKLIDENIDVLGLPIDFSNLSYRNKEQFETVIKILKYYKNQEKRPIIRVGTVITKDNFKNLKEIGDLLKNYKVDIWKIYEFLPQNRNAVNNKLVLEIPKEIFEKETKEVFKNFSNLFKITISNRKDRNRAYFFINPDGTVFMPIDSPTICKEKIIGHIFDSNIIEKWSKLLLEDNYIQNINNTFNKSK